MINSNRDWHKEKTYDSLMSYGSQTIRYVLLVNGGALISLLTFLGNNSDKAYDLRYAAPFFIFGLLSGIISSFLAYLAQFSLFNDRDDHMIFVFAAVCFILIGSLSFVVGAGIAMYKLTWGVW